MIARLLAIAKCIREARVHLKGVSPSLHKVKTKKMG